MAGHALKEKQPRLLIQNGVRRATRVARHVLLDVTSENVLNVFLLEPTLNDELVVSVNGTDRAQLGEEERQQMLGLTMKPK